MRLLHRIALASAVALSVGCSKTKSAGDDGGAASGSAGAAAPGATSEGTPAAMGLAFLEGFEGEIDAVLKKSGPASSPVAVGALIKSGKFRFDIPEKLSEGAAARMLGPKAYAIFDSGAKKLSVVSDARKQVIVIDMNKTAEQFKSFGSHPGEPGGPPQAPPPKITKTGKFETVAGYKCEDWDIASDHHEGTVCVAHEGISWFSIPAAVLPSERTWMLELLDGKHFPLRFISYGKDGVTEETRVEITKIDKKPLPASDFEYPPDYRVVDLDQMFQGLGGMPAGMGGGAPPGMPPGMHPGMPPGFTMPPMPHKAHQP
ncbi:MAG: DUF4412 domain-containing protein [Polyangiaceae bacterium]